MKFKKCYESEKTIYVYEDCSNYIYKSKCIKGNNSKILLEERTKKFETQKSLVDKEKKL